MPKGNKITISATDPVMVEILKRMGCEQEARPRAAQGNVGPRADNRQNISHPQEQVSYTIESLERLEREELFAIADSFEMDLANNTPTTRLIERIIARQNEPR